MKVIKKICLVLSVFLLVGSVAGYFYFDRKFTPLPNSLLVKGEVEHLPIAWESNEVSPMAALLLPVRLAGIPDTFYMQLDFGSPLTLFYCTPLTAIQQKYPGKAELSPGSPVLKSDFHLGNMHVTSGDFKILNYGEDIDWRTTGRRYIIGTIGTDLLEKRVTIMDFRNNTCSFFGGIPSRESGRPFETFEFNKRRILLPAKIGEEEVTLLYDSGTSAFELVTSKSNWERYKKENAKAQIDEANSWGNSLQTFTAESNKELTFGRTRVPLRNVTYIEGTSFLQQMLMRFSGMEGMTGNQLFKDRVVILDCASRRFAVY